MHLRRPLAVILAALFGCAGDAPQSTSAKQPVSPPIVDVSETAAPTAQADASTEVVASASAMPEAGPSSADPMPEPNEPESAPTETGGTEVDLFRARAGSSYRSRLWRFFLRGFHCPTLASGMAPCRASVRFHIAGDGTVASYELAPCGVPAVDAAAEAAAKARVGEQIPRAPNAYPDLHPSSLAVPFRCK